MAMIICPDCGKQASESAKICPSCGARLRFSKWWLVAILPAVLFALFMLIGFFASNTSEGKAKSADRRAIALCWKDYDLKSLEPPTKRFVASACEMMEANFKEKYGVDP